MDLSRIPTPHITCGIHDWADTVLMPGDPRRSCFIAENFLENPVLVNNARGIQGYTGTYHGKRVSVMASGMGIPSISLYAYELFNIYDVQTIIRIGSAGAIREGLNVRDLVVAMSAYTDSNLAAQCGFTGSIAPCCDYELLRRAVEVGQQKGLHVVPGAFLTSDRYYDGEAINRLAGELGVLAVDMEAAGLYLAAARARRKALAMCTISNDTVTGEGLTADELRTTLTPMIEIALEIA